MNTFSKAERLCKRTLIEKLFSHDASSFTIFPLRVIYLSFNDLEVNASVLISVSKKHFKRAVKRNCVKRRIREAYRINKMQLDSGDNRHWLIAFVYLSDEVCSSQVISDSVKHALRRISGKE